MAKRFLRKFWRRLFADSFFEDPENRVLAFAVSVSLVVHVVLLGIMTFQNARYSKKIQKNIEILYQTVAKVEKPQTPKDLRAIRQPELAPKPKSLMAKDSAVSTFSPKLGKSAARLEVPKADLSRMDMPRRQVKMTASEGKRQVSVPFLDSEKITNPKYLSYHDRVRNKIKNRAYLYVDNPAFDQGEVYLTFVVAASGEVTAIKLIEEKTRANDYLKGVGVRSVKESSPFPPFPEDLKYPELTFNVIISFETGD